MGSRRWAVLRIALVGCDYCKYDFLLFGSLAEVNSATEERPYVPAQQASLSIEQQEPHHTCS